MTLVSEGRRLDFHLARQPVSAARDATRNGIVIAHELPTTPGSAGAAGSTYPELADRVAQDTGWTTLTFTCRGAGRSAGQFSPMAWLEDLRNGVELLRAETDSVWLAGFGFGGALALRLAADDREIGGVAALATPSDFSSWIKAPSVLATVAHESGLIDSATPPDLDEWAGQLRALDPVGAARALPPRPLLIVHGSADDTIPQHDARALAEAAEGHGELRVVAMAGGRLRHDPRAIALLLGWLARHNS